MDSTDRFVADADLPRSQYINNDNYPYRIRKLTGDLTIDGKWTKKEWNQVQSLKIAHTNNWDMSFKPNTTLKLCYDNKYIYLISLVEDRYVRCLEREMNGEVHEDACIEFFFSPASAVPDYYFNLEINCGGTVKLGYHLRQERDTIIADLEDVKLIQVAHSLPRIVETEIDNPVTWVLEIALPFEMLSRYAPVTPPVSGEKWKANFYKCAENNSHPHWLSWAPVNSPVPNFHLPEFFKEIRFD